MLKPKPVPAVPEMTAKVARATFHKGKLHLHLRKEFGVLNGDADFAGLFQHTGQPGIPPWRLGLVTVFQFLKNLGDRQAADAVRGRIDWKYALSLALEHSRHRSVPTSWSMPCARSSPAVTNPRNLLYVGNILFSLSPNSKLALG